MRFLRTFALGFLATALVGGVFLGGYLLGQRGSKASTGASDPQFALLLQVRDLLSRHYVDQAPPAQAQAYGAVRGLVATYNDPYTVFVEPAPREVERDELRGHFGGIGAYMSRDESGALVLTVIRDRPAAKAGVGDGDVLLSVDGTAITAEMTVNDVVALVRGEVGTGVVLLLRRTGIPDPVRVVVKRERIDTPSVEWRVLDEAKHIGYVRVSIFGERTSDELKTAIGELSALGVESLVLDLRQNGGGLVGSAVDVASYFLSEGQVLREVRRGTQEKFYPVKVLRSAAQRWPTAVLVDAGTASASEIVAGALRDDRGIPLIGEKTYGKGSVQEVHELSDGSSLHVTVARWLTPKRNRIDKTGLEPDVTVSVTQADRDAGHDPQLDKAIEWLAGVR